MRTFALKLLSAALRILMPSGGVFFWNGNGVRMMHAKVYWKEHGQWFEAHSTLTPIGVSPPAQSPPSSPPSTHQPVPVV